MATLSEMAPFDVCGPLPQGTTLLEASAGTGKTFTIGALVARYVAEGVARLDDMLVITFGRAASQELRERVRSQLVEAERACADPTTADPTSTMLHHLLDVEEPERIRRRQRLNDALASFDAATIATTHQFCQLVLRSLGVAGDTDAGATLVDSLDELVVEVVDDLYLARFGQLQTPPPFGRDTALALARTVVGDPQAGLADPAPDDAAGAELVGFARAVRAEIDRRKRRLGLLSYDDLLSRLAQALADPDGPARARMRQRWRIVLVDEFQDTDPVQWQVLDRAFTGHATMVLIGDPKQAIYAFRGGDVVTYLNAAETATSRATLGTNWRSDAALVERLQVVLESAALGDPRIVVRKVRAEHGGSRLAGAPSPSAFRIRQVRRDGFKLTKAGLITAGDAREHIARDCAGDIAELLAARPTWCDRALVAGDVAVIVATREQGLLVQRALQERGLQAVTTGGGDVFLTAAGDDWLTLLEALEAPHRSGLVRAAALTCFLGLTAAELDDGRERLTARLADRLRGWALLVRGRGVAALVEAAEELGLTSRILGQSDGERLLTDVRHLGQLLHETSLREGLGLTALLAWFREERRRTTAAERPRRLDSDAAAVQIVTVHRSKGLQYPVTYLPFGYQTFEFPVDVARYHDGAGQRMLDVTGSPDAVERHRAEESGEELRTLYVALTRAQSQVVTWWAPTSNTPLGGLHRLLFGRQPGVTDVPARMDVRDDEYAARVLRLIEERGGPRAEVSSISEAVPALPAVSPGRLTARRFDRTVDTAWRRTSYSALIRVEESAHVGSEPEITGKDDELAEPLDQSERTVVDDAAALRSPMADLPAGATFGSLVHAVLEHTDPDAPDGLEAELLRHVTEQLRWWPVAAEPEALVAGLLPLHHTSLGPLAGGLTLAEIPLRDRLRELEFEIPLAGGDVGVGGVSASAGGVSRRLVSRRLVSRRLLAQPPQPPAAQPPQPPAAQPPQPPAAQPPQPPAARPPQPPVGEPRLRDLAPLLRAHLPADDPLAPYAGRLESPALGDQALRGYLSGSVDAVLRLPASAGGAFVVVDYKTNLLGEQTTADYAPDRLAAAMLHSDYPLQALLYCVVVHRFLRWRVPDYDPAVHLGGVLYLYLRGMAGPESPVVDGHPSGVFSWRPPAALVLALSDVLDGHAIAPAEGGAW